MRGGLGREAGVKKVRDLVKEFDELTEIVEKASLRLALRVITWWALWMFLKGHLHF